MWYSEKMMISTRRCILFGFMPNSYKNLEWFLAFELSSSSLALSRKKSPSSRAAVIPPFMFWYRTLNPSFFSPWKTNKSSNMLLHEEFYRNCSILYLCVNKYFFILALVSSKSTWSIKFLVMYCICMYLFTIKIIVSFFLLP